MLAISDLHVAYGQSEVLHGLNVAVAPNEIVAIMGRNGMGKTTLMKALMGILPSKSGSVSMEGTELGGLQSYPSRAKDPDPADYSTGSVGIGATAPVWSALAHRYVAGHFDVPQGGRQVSLVGDAELDEGAVWEAIVDPVVPHLGEVLWIVDLNRQSLDRVSAGKKKPVKVEAAADKKPAAAAKKRARG